MAESAEGDALKASDALSAAKMEAGRLRGLLGTIDTEKALEEAAVKVIQSERGGAIRLPTTYYAPYLNNNENKKKA